MLEIGIILIKDMSFKIISLSGFQNEDSLMWDNWMKVWKNYCLAVGDWNWLYFLKMDFDKRIAIIKLAFAFLTHYLCRFQNDDFEQ